MKTKQEQIEEMAEMCCDIKEDPNCKECVVSPLCGTKMDCTTLYKAGYRKASDVIDEFVERLAKKEIIGRVKGELTVVVPCEDIKKVIIEMRQEVEE